MNSGDETPDKAARNVEEHFMNIHETEIRKSKKNFEAKRRRVHKGGYHTCLG